MGWSWLDGESVLPCIEEINTSNPGELSDNSELFVQHACLQPCWGGLKAVFEKLVIDCMTQKFLHFRKFSSFGLCPFQLSSNCTEQGSSIPPSLCESAKRLEIHSHLCDRDDKRRSQEQDWDQLVHLQHHYPLSSGQTQYTNVIAQWTLYRDLNDPKWLRTFNSLN